MTYKLTVNHNLKRCKFIPLEIALKGEERNKDRNFSYAEDSRLDKNCRIAAISEAARTKEE